MGHIYKPAATLLAVLCIAASGFAQGAGVTGSGQFSLQGRLTSNTGVAIPDGPHTLMVNIYANGGATAAYSETDTAVTTDGIFSTMIGAKTASHVRLSSQTSYQIGISVDGQQELIPRLTIGQTPQAMTARSSDTAGLALNAAAVGGYMLDTIAAGVPHSILTLNSQGRVNAGILDSTTVTSVNGAHGSVNIVSGGALSVTKTQGAAGTTLSLGFTRSGGGLNLPFSQSVDVSSGTAFGITNTLGGSAAQFVNTGVGPAVRITGATGPAIDASSSGNLAGSATINAANTVGTALAASSNTGTAITATTAGTAINATSSASNAISATATGTAGAALVATATGATAISASSTGVAGAVVTAQSTVSAGAPMLLAGLNQAGTQVIGVAASGATTINSSASTALSATTTATGGTAARLTGALALVGPVGTGSIPAGVATATISNAFVHTNSMIFVTLTTAAGVSIPLTVTGMAEGSFSIAPVGGAVLLNAMTFNYLVINP